MKRLDGLIRKHTRDWVGPFADVFRDLAYVGRYTAHVRHCLHGDGGLTLAMGPAEFLRMRQRLFRAEFFSAYLRFRLEDDAMGMDWKLLPQLVAARELRQVTEVAFPGYLS